MKSANPNAPTKIALLDAAEQFMLRQGYRGVSIDSLCRQAKTGKSSFFHFFPSKKALAIAAAERYLERIVACARPRRRTPAAIARAWGEEAARVFEDPKAPASCLLGNLAQELASTDGEFRVVFARLFAIWSDALAWDLAAATRRRAPTAAQVRMGRVFLAALQGSIILAKAAGSRRIGAGNMRAVGTMMAAALGGTER